MLTSQLVCIGPWKPRRKHASLLWNNSIYIFGGFDGGRDSFLFIYIYLLITPTTTPPISRGCW